jgi:Ca-activated chloride channel family protein
MTRAVCTSLLVVVLAAALWGEDQLIRVNVDLVNVYLTVSNKRGHLITDLKKDSFAVFEDGAQQVITNFSRESDVPLTIVLLIDTSGSVKDKLQFEKQAAVSFLDTILRQNRDKAAVFTFDSTIDLQQDFTDDRSRLARAVVRTRAGGGTRLYDALINVMQQKLTGREERKVIVLLTDGDDNSSRNSAEQVVAVAQRNDVTIYTISMNAVGLALDDSQRGDRILKMFAQQTGGEAFLPASVKALPTQFKRITEELRSQYTIGYRSTNPKRDGAFRKIRIDVKNERYAIRTRPGYYAPQEVAAR